MPVNEVNPFREHLPELQKQYQNRMKDLENNAATANSQLQDNTIINPTVEDPTREGARFVDTLKEFVSDVNDLQLESKVKTEAFIKGEPVDIHDVMITAQKAKTSFELLMELRNKGLELYREVQRMQV